MSAMIMKTANIFQISYLGLSTTGSTLKLRGRHIFICFFCTSLGVVRVFWTYFLSNARNGPLQCRVKLSVQRKLRFVLRSDMFYDVFSLH